MIVLGIDPGTRHLGWGIVRRDGTRPTHVAHGVIDTDVTESIAVRLCQIERELIEVVETYRPTAAVVESLFFAKDATAAAKLGHPRLTHWLSRHGPSLVKPPPLCHDPRKV
jgi:crossover junction endodeoxyribonuclease RuvC